MSTSRDVTTPTDARLVRLLSRWLARHADDEELRRGLVSIGTAGLSAVQAEAVEELRAELHAPTARPGDLEMIVRETLEALALG